MSVHAWFEKSDLQVLRVPGTQYNQHAEDLVGRGTHRRLAMVTDSAVRSAARSHHSGKAWICAPQDTQVPERDGDDITRAGDEEPPSWNQADDLAALNAFCQRSAPR
jgi:hypothetical protein